MFSILMVALLAADEPAAAPPPKPEKVCREIKMETGSHMRGGRKCKTAEEWAIEDAKNAHLPVDARIQNNEDDIAKRATQPR